MLSITDSVVFEARGEAARLMREDLTDTNSGCKHDVLRDQLDEASSQPNQADEDEDPRLHKDGCHGFFISHLPQETRQRTFRAGREMVDTHAQDVVCVCGRTNR